MGAQAVHYVPEVPDDPDEQRELVERALAERPDAFLFVPVHPSALDAAVAKINRARIPIVGYINRLNAGECVSYVGADDYALAFKVARYVYQRLGGQGEVVFVDGPPESATSLPRQNAFRDAAAAYPGIRIAGRCNGRYLLEPARRAVAALIASVPHVDAVLAANDAMAIGALEALRAAGRSAPVAGVNATPEAIAAIKRGDMLVSADFNAMQMGCVAAECAVRHLRGETVPKEIMLPVELVDRSNCAAWDKPYAERACAAWDDILRAQAPGFSRGAH